MISTNFVGFRRLSKFFNWSQLIEQIAKVCQSMYLKLFEGIIWGFIKMYRISQSFRKFQEILRNFKIFKTFRKDFKSVQTEI